MLKLRDLAKTFPTAQGPLAVLRGLSLDLAAGESLALTGESGSGKSTLLHLVGGLERADAGRITIAEAEVTGLDDRGRARLRRETVGIVFQQFNLIPSLDVAANLALQARLAGRLDPGWLAELADRLGLAPLLDRYPEQLSGGQQQRVAIGRALAGRPRLILADEPTGNLDEATGDAVLDLLLGLVTESGAALMMVTHSERLAARLDTRAHLRAGRIDAGGTDPGARTADRGGTATEAAGKRPTAREPVA
ncbi:ABC transporter ATP-binding protein [Amaricoccus sp. W119]|uniref:ABC transporter ATP-binding protein n=1 Tax=Amaricoccus sp. W119 TaxID=3391833 RepID=UPI0039A6AE3E